MTPELERALAAPDARRLVGIGMANHAADLLKHAKNDEAEGYAAAASQRKADASFLKEVLLPAFSAQTGLELDQRAEMTAYLAGMLLRNLKTLKAQIARHLMDEQDGLADEAVVTTANALGHDMGRLMTMVAERAHHDGYSARELRPEETLSRVLGEVTAQASKDE